jgi:hypothetical protein
VWGVLVWSECGLGCVRCGVCDGVVFDVLF